MVKCEKHGCEMIKKEYDLYGKKSFYFCVECDKEETERQNKEHELAEKQARISYMKHRRIEPEYYEKDFDNFFCTTAELTAAKNACLEMVKNRFGKILMIGKNGTGKNHLAISVLKRFHGKIYTMFEISLMIRESYNGSAYTETQILEDLSNMDLLVIDEIGRSKGSDSEFNWLSYIIDKRHVRKLPLIMISNRHLKRNCKSNGCDKCLERYLDGDMISRISQDGIILELNGEDYRRK
jgi:DNA replication protein DnaC